MFKAADSQDRTSTSWVVHAPTPPIVQPPAGNLEQLKISSRAELPAEGAPALFVSYAWGDDSSDDARKRTEVVDRLCETLGQDGKFRVRLSLRLQSYLGIKIAGHLGWRAGMR
jgi:hypothetical protein